MRQRMQHDVRQARETAAGFADAPPASFLKPANSSDSALLDLRPGEPFLDGRPLESQEHALRRGSPPPAATSPLGPGARPERPLPARRRCRALPGSKRVKPTCAATSRRRWTSTTRSDSRSSGPAQSDRGRCERRSRRPACPRRSRPCRRCEDLDFRLLDLLGRRLAAGPLAGLDLPEDLVVAEILQSRLDRRLLAARAARRRRSRRTSRNCQTWSTRPSPAIRSDPAGR